MPKLFSFLSKKVSITKLKLFFLDLLHYALNAKQQKKLGKYFPLFDFGHFFLSIFKKLDRLFRKNLYFCTFAFLIYGVKYLNNNSI